MNKLELLNNLISVGEELTQTIKFVPSHPGIVRLYSVYATSQKEKYQNWQSSVLRYVKSYYESDTEEVKSAMTKVSPDNHRKMLGVLSAIKMLPEETKYLDEKNSGTNITINNSNTQNIAFNIFIEAIKDELTGKEIKQLKEILIEFDKEPDKNKKKLIEKVKELGSNVLSNIVTNILSNPNIYSGLI